MDIQHILERWFLLITLILCIGLALLFGALQAGIL
jgi:hypothetical protein